MLDLSRFWEGKRAKGVTKNEIKAWEQTYGLTLPGLLQKVLQRRNGGIVRGTQIRILRLSEIQPVDEDLWEFACYDEEEIPDHGLVFQFAYEEELGGQYLLNFNARGRRKEPSIYEFYSDPGDVDKIAGSLAKFFGKLLTDSDKPHVDWSETEHLTVLARERVDLSATFRATVWTDQVLGRQDGQLVLFTHSRRGKEETFTKTILPEPLDPDWASVSPLVPAPASTYALHLEPEDSEGIIALESTRKGDGRWKNETTRGVPVYVNFESTDQGRLEQLRGILFGKRAATAAHARDKLEQQLNDKVATLPPKEQRSAGLQMFLMLKREADRILGEQGGDLAEISPELARASELIQKKLQEAVRRAEQEFAQSEADPELAELVREFAESYGAGDDHK